MTDEELRKAMMEYCNIEEATPAQEKLIRLARVCLLSAKTGDTKMLPWGIKTMVEED